jgi:aminopeptidase N
MGGNQDARAWQQIVSALETIEDAERGASGNAAYLAYARSVLQPAFAALGFDARPGETPAAQHLRRALLRNLGVWGDTAVIAEMRRRFAVFMSDHRSLSPDDQEVVLGVVAHDADAALYDQLRALARSAADASEQQRDYMALAQVRDPQQAAQTAQIAISAEIPPQADMLRVMMVAELAHEHPQLSWTTFSANVDELLAHQANFEQLIIAQYAPQFFWNSMPLSDLETWVRAHVDAEMSPDVERGMETARFKLAEKENLVREADAYLHDRAAH